MRVALYARVSTEEQAIHGLSIEAQLADLRAWAKDKTVVGEYVDAGISARKSITKRPELQRLLRDIEAGKVDLVAFAKLDRWTRNIREYYKAQDVLDAHNVAWKALREDYETQTAAGRLKVNIMLAVAQDEADRTSERVKAVFEEKRRKGLTVNGHMPIGLQYREGVISPSEDAGKVKDLFSAYIATRSITATTARSRDILGKAYSSMGIRSLLMNERYLDAGVISPEAWETAQRILDTHGTRSVRTDRIYLFSGLLVCPECGGKLTVRTIVLHGREYVYYRCRRRTHDHTCPSKVSVREDVLEQYLLGHLLSLVSDKNLRIKKHAKKPVNVAAIQKKLDKLTDLYMEDAIDKADFDRRAAPLRDALKTARLTPQPADTEKIVSALDVYPGLSKAAQKAFWSALVGKITPEGEGYHVDLVLP